MKIAKLMEIPISESFEYNVRDLEKIIKRLMIELDSEDITMNDLPVEIAGTPSESLPQALFYRIPVSAAKKDSEERDIIRALEITTGHQSKVAKLFGLTPQAIYERLKNSKISAKSFKK